MSVESNRLGQETSPYLLQHQHNPVHWRAWSPETLALAKRSGRPVLLSVGYAACHWCHVMAHEFFENAEIAALMNEYFVNVKVDREERPDVDHLYQQALMMMGRRGGWPLTMFLTPDGQPFGAGHIFRPLRGAENPVSPRCCGRSRSCGAIARMRSSTMSKSSARDWPAYPRRLPGNRYLRPRPRYPRTVGATARPRGWRLRRRAKIPAGGKPRLSLAGVEADGSRIRCARASFLTLDHISQGGVYDHLGGGFARYSTDDRWLVPHFEKMLYDNAQLIELLTEVWQDERRELYRLRVTETIQWITREMRVPGGGFASSLDADSEGEEGKFYAWSEAEIREALGERAPFFERAYGVDRQGNWEHRQVRAQPFGIDRAAGRGDGRPVGARPRRPVSRCAKAASGRGATIRFWRIGTD